MTHTKKQRSYKAGLALPIILALSLFTSGCSGTRTVSTTEIHTNAEDDYSHRYHDHPRVEVTTTEQTTHQEGHKGFFGILGDIIAWPFRAIAAIL